MWHQLLTINLLYQVQGQANIVNGSLNLNDFFNVKILDLVTNVAICKFFLWLKGNCPGCTSKSELQFGRSLSEICKATAIRSAPVMSCV